jgi:hypothetical protein
MKTFAAVARAGAGAGPPIQRAISRKRARSARPPAMTLIVRIMAFPEERDSPGAGADRHPCRNQKERFG